MIEFFRLSNINKNNLRAIYEHVMNRAKQDK